MFKQEYELGFCDDYLFIYDCETTGLSSQNDKLIQLAGVLMKQDSSGHYRYHCLVDEYINHPNLEISEFTTELTGITQEKLETDGKSPELVQRKVDKLLRGKDVRFIAHNVSFDMRFLNSFLGYSRVRNDKTFCTLKHLTSTARTKFVEDHIEKYGGTYVSSFGSNVTISGGKNSGQHAFKKKSQFKLETLAEDLELGHAVTHNALDDMQVLLRLLEYINSHSLEKNT